MKTLCQCGHAKSQHQNKNGRLICDYKGYSCECTGYVKIIDPVSPLQPFERSGLHNLRCEYCNKPLSKTSAEFGMDCEDECGRKRTKADESMTRRIG